MTDPVAEYEVKDILGLALVIGVTGIVIAYSLDVTADQRDEFQLEACTAQGYTLNASNHNYCYNSSGGNQAFKGTLEFNSTTDGMSGVDNLSKKLPTIGLVIGAVVIVGLLIAGFGRYMR